MNGNDDSEGHNKTLGKGDVMVDDMKAKWMNPNFTALGKVLVYYYIMTFSLNSEPKYM